MPMPMTNPMPMTMPMPIATAIPMHTHAHTLTRAARYPTFPFLPTLPSPHSPRHTVRLIVKDVGLAREHSYDHYLCARPM